MFIIDDNTCYLHNTCPLVVLEIFESEKGSKFGFGFKKVIYWLDLGHSVPIKSSTVKVIYMYTYLSMEVIYILSTVISC